VTEYALMIKLVGGTSSAHSFNPYAYFGHSWSYFDIQNLRLVIIYLFLLSKFLVFSSMCPSTVTWYLSVISVCFSLLSLLINFRCDEWKVFETKTVPGKDFIVSLDIISLYVTKFCLIVFHFKGKTAGLLFI
jgi:hypothetical protein